jgi:hypothetical protein
MHSADSVVSCCGCCCALQLLGRRLYSVQCCISSEQTACIVIVLAPSSRYLSFLAVALAAPDSDAEEVAEEGGPVKTAKPSLTRSSTSSTGELAIYAVYSATRAKQLLSNELCCASWWP